MWEQDPGFLLPILAGGGLLLLSFPFLAPASVLFPQGQVVELGIVASDSLLCSQNRSL